MSDGYRELRESAAWIDLSSRGKIFAAGEDRARLLHAMTSNQIEALQPGQGCYAFFLNAQGRVLADVNALCLPDRFLLDTEPEVREKIYQHLDKYIIADDVTLEDASDRLAAIAIEGPTAADALRSLGARVPEVPFSHLEWEQRILACISFTGAPGWRIFLPVEEKVAFAAYLQDNGLIPALPEVARVVRLENAKPRYGEDIYETTLAQETQQQHALNFNKGCYLGQEIVERVRSRGHLNKMLVSVRIEGQEPPDRLTRNGNEVGEVTSAVYSPALGKVVGLAYVRAPAAQPGTEIQAGEHTGVVGTLYAP
ncbi:MAG: glycine cleavage T C-terminal barrel domain-containing protein [Bryobacteraceae bacterium]